MYKLIAVLIMVTGLNAGIVEDMARARETAQKNIVEKTNTPTTPATVKKELKSLRESQVNAEVYSTTYNFQWPMGYNWYHHENYTLPAMDIVNLDYSGVLYDGQLSTWIHLLPIGLAAVANNDLDYGKSQPGYNGTQEMLPTTFSGYGAFLNSYSYLASGFRYAAATYHFDMSGRTYSVGVFSNVTDYNTNIAVYNLLLSIWEPIVPTASKERQVTGKFLKLFTTPNPFQERTTINFNLNQSGLVELGVYSMDGVLIKHLVNRHLSKGQHKFTWDGRDAIGETVAKGVYITNLKGEDIEARVKLLRLK